MLRIFLSGRFDVGKKVERAWLERTGCKHRCFTYAQIDKYAKHYNKKVIASLKVCEEQKIGIMLDSGAASIHVMQAATSKRGRLAEEKTVVDTDLLANQMFDRYAKYCLANHHKWTFFVTLDFQKHQPTIMEMQKRFEAKGLRPMPVYHGDSELEWLDRWKDKGYKLIGLGTVLSIRSKHTKKEFRYYLDRVFDRCAKLGLDLHGLAMTSLPLMLQYPWWSVDSATWTKTASFGCLNFPNYEKGVIQNIHISAKHASGTDHSYNKLPRRHRDQILSVVKDLGFDLKELQTSVAARHDFNGYVFSHLASVGIDLNKVRRRTWETLL